MTVNQGYATARQTLARIEFGNLDGWSEVEGLGLRLCKSSMWLGNRGYPVLAFSPFWTFTQPNGRLCRYRTECFCGSSVICS